MAFSVVLDRRGSMRGEPLTSALRAAKTAVQNLRRADPFAVITFDEAAEVVSPTGPVSNKPAVLDRIDRIRPGGRTPRTGGWMLGREALRSTTAGSHPGTSVATPSLEEQGALLSFLAVEAVTFDSPNPEARRADTLRPERRPARIPA